MECRSLRISRFIFSTHAIVTIIPRKQLLDNSGAVHGYRLHYFMSKALVIFVVISFVFCSCSLINSNFDSKANLVIQVIDPDTKLELEDIEVNLLVEGKVLNKEKKDFRFLTDAAGRIQFQGLPKGAFRIEVPESDNYVSYDSTFMPGAFVRNSSNTLSIILEKKRAVFIGIVMDAESDQAIAKARVEFTETVFHTVTDSKGKFELEVPNFKKGIQYQIGVSKEPEYYPRSIDIVNLHVNSVNDMHSITMRRTPEWVPPNFRDSTTYIDTTWIPGGTRVGG